MNSHIFSAAETRAASTVRAGGNMRGPTDQSVEKGGQPRRSSARMRTFGIVLFLTTVGLSVLLTILILFVPTTRQVLGCLVLGLTVSLMMSGVHVAVSMAIPGLLGAWKLNGLPAVAYTLRDIPQSSVANWTLIVIPLFVLMGLVLFHSGIASVMFDAAKQWIGHVPGGLGVATIAAGAGMSAASGSTLGVTYATTRIATPEMLKANYSPRMAVGTVVMAGALKLLIPPSITLFIYAALADTPVGPQLLAGVVPGILLAILFALVIIVRSHRNPKLAPAVDNSGVTLGTKIKATLRAWPVFILVVIIVGGIYSGIVTPTESGALAALSAIIIGGWLTRRDGLRAFVRLTARALRQTAVATAAIMLLLVGIQILTTSIALTGLLPAVSQYVSDLGLSRVGLLLILVLMYLVMGMFMDELAMMLLTVPVLLPILQQFDINLIWFGIFLVLLCEIGMVAPPVGLLSFVVAGIVQDKEVNLGHSISLADVFAGVIWFVVAALGLVIVLIFVPDLVLWLPGLAAD